MAFREVCGLTYAALTVRPAARAARSSGAKAAGLRYERAVASALPRAQHGQWFEYWDVNGPGMCQTDLLIVGAKTVLVMECKLSNVDEGRAQLRGLYLPVAQMVWPEKDVLGIVVARHLSRESALGNVRTSLRDAVELARQGELPTLHWLERTNIGV